MWFSEVAAHSDPGRKQLVQFLDGVRDFLGFSLENKYLSYVWKGESQLHQLAKETFRLDVLPAIVRLQHAISDIPDRLISEHGLSGRALKFKLSVADAVGKRLSRARRHFSVRKWFARTIDAVDAILDSVIQAAGSVVGALIKEFKDSLRALA